MPARRSKWRAYLLLSRVSNLPTVWSNAVAGAVVAGAPFAPFDIGWVAAGASFLYTAGMLLNDLFDRDSDAKYRPDRPLPAGDVMFVEVMRGAIILMTVGVGMIASRRGGLVTLPWSGALVLAIVYYDWRHKRDPLGPLWMGVCRGLVYCVAAAAVASTVSTRVAVAAVVVTAYVVLLTQIAKRLGPRASIVVPLLIAGISVVDAAIIAVAGGGVALVLLAVVCGVLTLGLQRVVPGT